MGKSCKKPRCRCVDECPACNTATVLLTSTPTPVIMKTDGSERSKARTLIVEGDVSPQPSTVPSTARFQLRLDGQLVDPIVLVTLNALPGLTNATRPGATLRTSIPVGPGPHTVELLASSDDAGVDLLPNGACLSVARERE